jgi:hypothetical protein
MAGKIPRLVFCIDACCDFAGEIAVAAKRVNQHGDAQDEHHENYVVEFPCSVVKAELKQFGSEIIGVGHNEGESCRPEKNNGVSGFGTPPIKPTGRENA